LIAGLVLAVVIGVCFVALVGLLVKKRKISEKGRQAVRQQNLKPI
jgi:hypothetical protein